MISKYFYIHVFFIIIGSIILFLISSYFDLFEKAYCLIERHEKFNLDEVLIVSFFSTLYLFVWAIVFSQKLKKRYFISEKLSQKLQEEIETKNKYHAIIAHDLKEPFNSLMGLSEILLHSPEDVSSERGLMLVESIHSTSKTSYAFLENLLQWSRIQNGAIKANVQKVDIEYLVNSVLAEIQQAIANKQIVIECKIPQNSYALTDETMFAFIIRNLLTNAVKFSNPGAKVFIQILAKQNSYYVEVKDEGVGLSSEQIDNIFSNKLNTTVGTNNEKGSGFGLEICREFISMIGGTLKVESVLGEGSIFSFRVHNYSSDK